MKKSKTYSVKEPYPMKAVAEVDVIKNLKYVAKKLGHVPTYKEYNTHGKYNPCVFKRIFGTYNEALTAIGLEINRKVGYDKDEVLTEIRRQRRTLGITPSLSIFTANTGISDSVIEKLFGSWNEALTQANIKILKNQNITLNKIIGDLLKVQVDLRHRPTYNEYRTKGRYNVSVIERVFGTWNEAWNYITETPANKIKNIVQGA
jgi:hypothetical protein